MRLLRTLVTCAAAAAVTIVVPPAVAQAAPSAPFTALVYDAGTATWPVSGVGAFDPSNSTLTPTLLASDGFAMTAVSGNVEVAFRIDPPTGQTWTSGQTYTTTASPPNDSTASLMIAFPGRGCSTTPGSIEIKEVVRNPDTQALTGIAGTFWTTCDNPKKIYGEIRWNSTIDYVADVFAPAVLDFGADEVGGSGTTKAVTFTSQGSQSVTFSTATLGGTTPAAFSIVDNTCTGNSFAYGETCTVTIQAHATAASSQSASLMIADDTASGQKVVPLQVYGQYTGRGMYFQLPPQRIMDTRFGIGAPKALVGPGATVSLQVSGRGGVPGVGYATAVVLNVTIVSPAAGGYLTVYPTGVTRPTASSLNFVKGWTGANSVTVALGTGGKVDIYNAGGSANIIVDVFGYYGTSSMSYSGGHYQPIPPLRLLDTREDLGFKLPGGYYINVPVSFGSTVNPHIRAFAVNVTAVYPTASGYLTAWDGNEYTFPSTSTLNYTANKVVPNMAIVPSTPCVDCGSATGWPSIGVYTSKTAHVLVDLVGVFDDGTLSDGLRFTPITPTRITDSRIGLGLPGALGAGQTGGITTPDTVLTQPNTEVLALNVTAVNPTASTYLTVWPNGLTRPTVSNLNPAAGQTVPNAVLTLIGAGNQFNVFNASGTTNILVDVVGTFWLYPGTATVGFTSGSPVSGIRVPGPSLVGVTPTVTHLSPRTF